MVGEPSSSVKRELLRRILASRHFAHGGLYKRVLAYLCDRSWRSGGNPPKEYEVAVEAMGRPPSFDPASDPVVRVTISQLRKRLAAFFRGEGAHLQYRLEVLRGRYEVRVVRCAVPSVGATRPLHSFWEGFRDRGATVVIAYTEPLFFTDRNGCFVRHWQVNRSEGGVRALLSRAPALANLELEPAYHYLSAGEMRCLLSLGRCLAELRVPTDFRSVRYLDACELRRNHAILLGSPRTNPLLEQLQQGLLMRVTADAVALPGGRCLQDRRAAAGPVGERLHCWAVLSRFRHPVSGSRILLLAANNGSAIEGAGKALTVNSSLSQLLKAVRSASRQVDAGFQALLEVRVEERQGSIEHVCIAETAPVPCPAPALRLLDIRRVNPRRWHCEDAVLGPK